MLFRIGIEKVENILSFSLFYNNNLEFIFIYVGYGFPVLCSGLSMCPLITQEICYPVVMDCLKDL